MMGLPYFGTRKDVENALLLFPEKAKIKLKSLYEDRYVWVEVSELESREAGVEDDFHIVTTKNTNMAEEQNEEVFVQLEKQVDPNAQIYRLGFTDEEIMSVIKGV